MPGPGGVGDDSLVVPVLSSSWKNGGPPEPVAAPSGGGALPTGWWVDQGKRRLRGAGVARVGRPACRQNGGLLGGCEGVIGAGSVSAAEDGQRLALTEESLVDDGSHGGEHRDLGRTWHCRRRGLSVAGPGRESDGRYCPAERKFVEDIKIHPDFLSR